MSKKMSNMQQAGPTSGGNKNRGDKNVIHKYAIVNGDPITGDHSGNTTNSGNTINSGNKKTGNTINSGNKKTEVRGPMNDNRIMDNHDNEKCSYSMGTSNYGDGKNGCISFQ